MKKKGRDNKKNISTKKIEKIFASYISAGSDEMIGGNNIIPKDTILRAEK